jgi:putative transposase
LPRPRRTMEKSHPIRKNLRLRHYDYRNPGNYFITVCTHERRPILASIENNILQLTSYGEIAKKFWLSIPEHFPKVKLDSYIVMPNHFHGILYLESDSNMINARKEEKENGILKGSIGSIIGSWKSISTKNVNQLRNTLGAQLWQRNYYERIIRDEKELQMIRTYIENNPYSWEKDSLYVPIETL